MCANCHLTELFKARLSYIRPTASEVTTLWRYRNLCIYCYYPVRLVVSGHVMDCQSRSYHNYVLAFALEMEIGFNVRPIYHWVDRLR